MGAVATSSVERAGVTDSGLIMDNKMEGARQIKERKTHILEERISPFAGPFDL
jgi:hypothetical protein